MKPAFELVERIANEEALRSRCTLDELLHMSRRPDAKQARLRAWARIIQETGCKGTELAAAWGCYPESVWRAFPTGVKHPPRPARPAPTTVPKLAQPSALRVTIVPVPVGACLASLAAMDRIQGFPS